MNNQKCSKCDISEDLRKSCEQLDKQLRGRVLFCSDPEYAESIKLWNAYHSDKHPKLVIRCLGTTDVSKAVQFVRNSNLRPLSVKSGGHGVAGRAVNNGGVVIDLSLMQGVHVSRDLKTVEADGGATWGDVVAECEYFGKGTPGGVVSSTGVAGLTLGGGYGWLSPDYGMCIDNLLEAELVLADGKIVIASESENSDLFWAIRGGGGNFGIATRFKFKLYPLSRPVTAGLIAVPLSKRKPLLDLHFKFQSKALEQCTHTVSWPGIIKSPFDGQDAFTLLFFYNGRAEEVADCIGELNNLDFLFNTIQEKPFSEFNQELDPILPKGRRYFWKDGFMPGLTEDLVNMMVEEWEKLPQAAVGSSIFIENYCGPHTGNDPTKTAFPHRGQPRGDMYDVSIDAAWEDPAADAEMIAWVRQTHSRLLPMFRGAYSNFLAEPLKLTASPVEQARSLFRDNLPRLQKLKKLYDPENLFSLNHNLAVDAAAETPQRTDKLAEPAPLVEIPAEARV